MSVVYINALFLVSITAQLKYKKTSLNTKNVCYMGGKERQELLFQFILKVLLTIIVI